MSKFTAAAVQMVSGADLDKNLLDAEKLIEQAASFGAECIVLPETFAMFASSKLHSVAVREHDQQTVQHFLSTQARNNNCLIVGGTTPLLSRPDGSLVEDGRVRAASCVYAKDGTQIARYDKIHLFDVDVEDAHGAYRESATMEPGADPVVVRTDLACFGLTVCYDLRFPELYRRLTQLGAEVLLVPAAFTATTGAAHWMALLRARAIENQCFVIAADQGGRHTHKRKTHGESLIINPWGETLNCLQQGAGVVCATIDLDYLREVRRKLPALQHRVL